MRLEHAEMGWVMLFGYVAAYDLWAIKTKRESLSHAFYRGVQHPKKRWITIWAWGTLTAHLFNIIPDKLDPIHMIGELFS